MDKLGMAGFQLSDANYANYLNDQKLIIKSKPLLRYCYQEWYQHILKDVDSLQHIDGDIIELGSGGGFLKEFIPQLITSDVIEGVADRVVKAPKLPLEDNSVKALILVQVFHHIPNISVFLSECERVLKPNGALLILDPAHTLLARFLMKNFHTEPYDDKTQHWDFESSGKATDANQANTWNIFVRDRNQFEAQYPTLKLECSRYFRWLSYILAGGVSGKNRIPKPLTKSIQVLDNFLNPINKLCSLMWYLRINKKSN